MENSLIARIRLDAPAVTRKRSPERARAREHCEMVFLGMRMTSREDTHSRLEEAPDRFFTYEMMYVII